MVWRPIDISICRQIHRHTDRKINTWTHKTFECFDLHFSLFPFHAKTRSHTPQMVISLQTSFKNEPWQRPHLLYFLELYGISLHMGFKMLLRRFKTAPRRLQDPPRRLQDAPRRLWDAFRRPQDASKRFQDIVSRCYRSV